MLVVVGHCAVVVVCAILVVLGGDPLVRLVFRLSEPPKVPTSTPILVAAAATLKGGRAIGWLERLSAFVCVFAGFPAGLAGIVAVKGLARYPDLKGEDGTAERFIIGTLASLLVAAAGAGLARWAISLF